jgi:hypothetical protein
MSEPAQDFDISLALTPSMWLDAADPSTLFTDTAGSTPATVGGRVGRWSDKSGNGWSGTQEETGSRPLLTVANGLPGVLFENQFLQHQLNQPAGNTIFAVVSMTRVLADMQGLFSATAPDQPLACYLEGKAAGVEAWGGYRPALGHFNSGHAVTAAPAVITLTSDAAGGVMRHNKHSEVSYASPVFHQDSQERRLIGTARTTQDFWQGIIHELVVLPYVAAPDRCAQVQDDLMHKWVSDHDAAAYLAAVQAAGVVTTQTQANAVTAFIMAEKAGGRWPLHKRIFLPVWGNAAANAIDMVTRAVGVWSGMLIHAPGYVEAGVDGGFLVTSTVVDLGLTRTEHCLSVLIYRGNQESRTAVAVAGRLDANGIQLLENREHEIEWYSASRTPLVIVGNAGIFVGSRTHLRGINLVRRTAAGASSVVGNQMSRGFTDQVLSGFRRLAMGTPLQGDQRIGVFHIGLGLEVGQAEDFSGNLKILWEATSRLSLS